MPVYYLVQSFNLLYQLTIELIELLSFFQEDHKRDNLHWKQVVCVSDWNAVLQDSFKELVQNQLIGAGKRSIVWLQLSNQIVYKLCNGGKCATHNYKGNRYE